MNIDENHMKINNNQMKIDENKWKFIRELAKAHDIIFLQETHGTRGRADVCGNTKCYVDEISAGFKAHWSHLTRSAGGWAY